ncbi:13830_t:CDS:1, partial [Gigaspora margarita]
FKLELSNLELQELEQKLANYQAFSTFQPSFDLYYIETILKGLIPISIIQSIQSFNIFYKIASITIIQILLDINKQIYDQIWISYCCNFST